ncbi:MAG: GTPase, partial [Nitrososphaeria archaeon]
MQTVKYALVGAPNVGKSTIFYRLVGRRVKIAN